MIYGVVKTSYVDYPNRLCSMIFIGGCNMRCPYCHNPEIVFKQSSVIAETEILSMLEDRKDIIEAVCISGGEPTVWKGLTEFIKKIKAIGLKVKLDSNGTNPVVLGNLLKEGLLDYIAIDIKATAAKYELTTGVNLSTDKIYESVRLIKESGVDYEFRTTVHSNYTNSEDLISIAKDISPAKRYILQGFVSRDQHVDNNSKQGNTISPTDLNQIKEIIQSKGLIDEVLVR